MEEVSLKFKMKSNHRKYILIKSNLLYLPSQIRYASEEINHTIHRSKTLISNRFCNFYFLVSKLIKISNLYLCVIYNSIQIFSDID